MRERGEREREKEREREGKRKRERVLTTFSILWEITSHCFWYLSLDIFFRKDKQKKKKRSTLDDSLAYTSNRDTEKD